MLQDELIERSLQPASSGATRFLSAPSGRFVTALTATCLWGSAFPVVKVGYGLLGIRRGDTFLQIEYAGYRFVLAALLLFALMTVAGVSRPPLHRAAIVAIVRVGAVQTFLQYVFFYAGIAMSSGMEGSIIAGTLTFFQLGLAHLMHADDRMTATKVVAAVLGFAGIVLYHVMANGYAFTMGRGEALMLLAMFLAAFGNMLSKQAAPAVLPVLPLTAMQMLIGGVALIAVGAANVGIAPFDFSLGAALVLAYLAFVSAAIFLLWNSLMSYNKAGAVSIYLFLVPIFGVLLSSALLGEPLQWYVAPALVLVAIGIVMTHAGAAGRADGPDGAARCDRP
ncbi:DMT family transporter [Burkholderia paludis]|uniref:DMT family transporter n=1 Tax=Burkholderia paludis TaxID=1506587 RepID=UPI00068F10A1|nr:DMT family transporter [Burkholderia paludis]